MCPTCRGTIDLVMLEGGTYMVMSISGEVSGHWSQTLGSSCNI
jgi:hypothetical protein